MCDSKRNVCTKNSVSENQSDKFSVFNLFFPPLCIENFRL